MNNAIRILVGSALLAVSSISLALPTTGGISFGQNGSGAGYDNEKVWFGTGFDDPELNAQVVDLSGDFLSDFSLGEKVAFNDFTYDPLATPTQLVWTSDTMEFYLENITFTDFQVDSLKLKGTGYLSEVSGDDTSDLTWIYTGNKDGETISWSASNAAVPEPGTLALLGLGVLGLGAARRRKA